MVVMALDHTRGFFSNVTFYPLDLDKTNVPLFLTRWITHYCAPVFVFLAGAGAFLASRRGKTKPELSWFLFSRGLWLVLLEITIIRWFGWAFSFDMHFIGIGVIWAIGWSMIVLSALIFLPIWAVAAFGVLMISIHNAFDGVTMESWGGWQNVWKILHVSNSFDLAPGYKFGTGYPLIPWIGVMAAGYGFGAWLVRDTKQRQTWTLRLGVVLTVLFVLVRGSNLYGDLHPWSPQKSGVFTVFSFLHCHKYPPSLCYLLMTLGPALILLSFFEGGTPRLLQPLVTFGRVPLFYYVLHLPLIHSLALIMAFTKYGHAEWLYGTSPESRPADYGYDLPVVYFFWIVAVLILYPACRRFAEVKRRRREAWLSYF